MGTAHKANSRIGWPHLNDGTGRAKDVLAQFCRSRILSRELDDFRLMLRIWVRVVLQAAHAIRLRVRPFATPARVSSWKIVDARASSGSYIRVH